MKERRVEGKGFMVKRSRDEIGQRGDERKERGGVETRGKKPEEVKWGGIMKFIHLSKTVKHFFKRKKELTTTEDV